MPSDRASCIREAVRNIPAAALRHGVAFPQRSGRRRACERSVAGGRPDLNLDESLPILPTPGGATP